MIKNFLKATWMRLFPTLWLYRSLFSGSSSYLRTTGWRTSCQKGVPCRPDGSPLPWMNYSIISFLEKRLTKDLSLFEYGSGFSTHFYSRLVGEVTSVEHDRAWYDRIRNELAPNVDLLYVAKDIDGEYCRTIHEFEGDFDVVIVDGRDRVNCVKQSLEKLSARGVIILDDSDRSRYSEGIEYALSHGFRALEFEGLKPTGIGAVVSTLFYRADNCVNL